MFLHKDSLATLAEIKKEFIFNNDSSAMYPLLHEVISYLKIHLPSDQYAFKISNCKQILIELLTNAIKHSNTDTTVLTVCISGRAIEITKTDKGEKFYLCNDSSQGPLSWPIEKEYIGKKVKIYEDGVACLRAIVKSENRIVFDMEEYPVKKANGNSNLLEHYGLLIMAKFSSEFFYVYNPSTRVNQFTTVINV